MNRDTYARFLRSEAYKELLLGGKKKVSNEFHIKKIEYIFLQNKKTKLRYIYFVHCFSTFFGQTHVKMHIYTYIHNHSDNKDGCGDGGGSFSDSVNLLWDYG